MLAGDYVLITSSAKIIDRAAMLAGITDPSISFTLNRAHDQRVRVYNGPTAIVTGVLDQAATAGGKRVSYSVRYTDTWVLLDGSWREASGHASLITRT